MDTHGITYVRYFTYPFHGEYIYGLTASIARLTATTRISTRVDSPRSPLRGAPAPSIALQRSKTTPRYNTRWRDMRCEAVDAAWRCERKWCNPPGTSLAILSPNVSPVVPKPSSLFSTCLAKLATPLLSKMCSNMRSVMETAPRRPLHSMPPYFVRLPSRWRTPLACRCLQHSRPPPMAGCARHSLVGNPYVPCEMF